MANVLNLQADTVEMPQDAKGRVSTDQSIFWCSRSTYSIWACG